ncbi:MAG TPA: hypothetical protein EYQ14_30500 [Gammaproteobacteria bacterium]|nr:hypothetical protein [Gammaproteobacteria bacterium]
MKYSSLIFAFGITGLAFQTASVAQAQYIICDNQLVNVNGNWIGAWRDSGLCDQIEEPEVCEQGADESDGNLGECDTSPVDTTESATDSADDANTFNCRLFNSGYVEVMPRFDRAIICAATQTVMTGSRDEGGAGNTYSPDYHHFNYCLAAEGFSGAERHRIIEWWPPTPARSPIEAAMLMKQRANRELTAMKVCSQLGVNEGDYDPPWNTCC